MLDARRGEFGGFELFLTLCAHHIRFLLAGLDRVTLGVGYLRVEKDGDDVVASGAPPPGVDAKTFVGGEDGEWQSR